MESVTYEEALGISYMANSYGRLETVLSLYSMSSLPVTLLVCKDDTVVDPKFAIEFFTGNAKVIIFETGGHRMENTEEMLAEIEKAICNYCD